MVKKDINIEKLGKVLDAMNFDSVRPEEFQKAFNSVLDVIEVWKGTQIKLIKELKDDPGGALQTVEKRFEEVRRAINLKAASIRNGLDGRDGKAGRDGLDGIDGKDGKDGKDGSPDTPEQIVSKLNSTENSVNMDVIKGLKPELERLGKLKGGKMMMNSGTAGRDLVRYYDLSTSLDGVTKTFNLPAIWRLLGVWGSSTPIAGFRETIDYTWTTTSITFTSQIDASTTLAIGQSITLLYVIG